MDTRQAFREYMGIRDTANDHEKKLMLRAEKYTHILSFIPGIKMIAVVNSLSMNVTHPDSDIDLFIICRPGSLYTVRFFSTLLLWCLGVWRHGREIAGNFCLSFFITHDAMSLEPIAIDNDIYLREWIRYMKPLYETDHMFQSFQRANLWIDTPGDAAHMRKNSGDISNKRTTRDIMFVLLFFPLEFLLRTLQKRRALSSYQKKGCPQGVIISDTMLKFHDNDRRETIRDEIMKKYFDK